MSHRWSHKRVTLMGLGRHGGGVGAARWLAAQDARLTITDLADERSLVASLAALSDVTIERLRLGPHVEEDFSDADAVIVNPAVRPGHPLVEMARRRGAEILTEIELFLGACPARVVGVTGSNGKSTTADMLAAMLHADGRPTWLGGNFGGSLLDNVERMTAADWVVLELSSFQLHYLSPPARLPEVAVVTNCSPNHLDWHGTYEHYVAAKQRLLTSPCGASLRDATHFAERSAPQVVLNSHDAEVASWAPLASGRVLPLYSELRLPPLQVPGVHNRHNAACAATAALAVGCDEAAIHAALAQYRGLPHRLEWVGEVAGRRFYNDSKATTPPATLAAMDACEGPVWLLAGGHEKGGDYETLARQIAARVRGAALFGRAGPMLYDGVRRHAAELPLASLDTLQQALSWCWNQSSPGDTILLSPACASFDQFQDFAERGNTFAGLVRELAAAEDASTARSTIAK